MVVNESFLDSATIKRKCSIISKKYRICSTFKVCSKGKISFSINTTSNTPTLTLSAGLVCVGATENTQLCSQYHLSITTTVTMVLQPLNNIEVFQGTFLRKQFLVDGSLDQRFLLDNSFIDSSTIVVKVAGLMNTNTLGREYSLANNILNIDSTSEIYLIQEVQDEKYELLFGDGYFGKKLENGAVITATYIITDGKDGNGSSNFSYAGRVVDSLR